MSKKSYTKPQLSVLQKTVYPGIGRFCRALILQGLSNTEVLKRAQRKFPDSKVSYHSVAFYKSEMRRNAA